MSITERGHQGAGEVSAGALGPVRRHGVRDLVLAHQQGDPAAFDEMVRRFYPALLIHARRRLNDAKGAEDAVQEAFLRAYRSLGDFDGEYQLGAWLHRILSNVCLTEGARRRREAEGNQRWATMEVPLRVVQPDEYGDQAEALARVVAAMERLSPAHREAFVLRDVLELDYADVADRTGVTEDNARARVHRARAALRKMVDRSASVGALVAYPFRRLGRFGARVTQHANAAVAWAPPDAVAAAPVRVAALGTIATTGAAVAMAAGIPLLVRVPQTSAPSVPPSATTTHLSSGSPSTAFAGRSLRVTRGDGGQGAGAVASAAGATTTSAPTTTSRPTTSTNPMSTTTMSTNRMTVPARGRTMATTAPTTVTTTPTTSTTAAGGSPAPGSGPLATIGSAQVATDAGSGTTEAPAVLHEGGQADQEGRLITRLLIPSASAPACQGRIRGRFDWGATADDPQGDTASFTAVFVDGTREAAGTLYRFRGRATDHAPGQALDGTQGVTGTLFVPADGSPATMELDLVPADQVNQPATCTPAGPWQDGNSRDALNP